MPYTVNGIGTHYYGKKNRSTRTGICKSCQRVGLLESYDTRLWFVIVFVPVIPLGRKRIIDQCPSCHRHYVANADKYEQARQLQTSGTLEQYRRQPTPGAALEAHAQLLAFHEHDQAAEFRQAALARFPDDAELRAGLAAQLREVSSFDEAGTLFDDALRIDPELPEARAGVALRRIARGELDAARSLLEFLEIPGAGQHHSLYPIDVLSSAYQNQGRHDEALALSEILIRELPQVGQLDTFRRFVRKSEQALRRPESLLPPREHSLRGLFRKEGSPYPAWLRRTVISGVAVALLAAGLFLNNDYIRRHRRVYVVNATGQPVQVRVDGGPAQTFGSQGRLYLGEGHHRLTLSGAVEEAQDVDVSGSFFERWFGKTLRVLNPGGEAVLDERTVVYAEHPRPGSHHLIAGQTYTTLPEVDYAFRDPPKSVEVKNRNEEVTRVAVEQLQGRDSTAFFQLDPADHARALTFAERRLRRNPRDEGLLNAYLSHIKPEERDRAVAFLKTGLALRPVNVNWHRGYQSLAEMGQGGEADPAGLVAQYDRFLAAEPSNGALLYLRGRVDPDWDRQATFYREATEADPHLGWPWMALGRRATAAAHWKEGLADLRKAQERNMDSQQVREEMHTARLADGEAQELVAEYQAQLNANPMEPIAVLFLVDALVVAGQAEQAPSILGQWENRLPPDARAQWGLPFRAMVHYQTGHFFECAEACRQHPTLQHR